MTHYPDPITIPSNVAQERAQRNKEIMHSGKRGIAIRFSIILAELAGVAIFGSSALLMDALSSLIDVASTLFLMLCIKLAERPPDANHPFGHGRYEPLAGLQLGLFMVIIGGGMLFQQSYQLTQVPEGKVLDKWVWIIPFGALVLLELSYQLVMRTAKKQNSPALAADAVHYRIDGATSLFAAIALIFAAYIPEWSLFIDHLGAILIALLMIGIGLYAAKNNLNQVMDHIPENKYFQIVQKAAKAVPGVFDTEKIRIQVYGPDAHVDIDIEVEPHLPVEEAHKISQQVRAAIQKEWPAVRDVTVHIEPYYPGDH